MQEKERENAVNEQQIYLDYAANTPVDQCVLNCYCQAAVTYMGNPNSKHYTGLSAKEAISRATAHMAELLQVSAGGIDFHKRCQRVQQPCDQRNCAHETAHWQAHHLHLSGTLLR